MYLSGPVAADDETIPEIVRRVLSPGPTKSASEAMRHRVLEYVRGYSGLPVTSDDVHEDLGISIKTAKSTLAVLAHSGLLAVKVDPDNHSRPLFLDPKGWEAGS
jgi:hypothetical protein